MWPSSSSSWKKTRCLLTPLTQPTFPSVPLTFPSNSPSLNGEMQLAKDWEHPPAHSIPGPFPITLPLIHWPFSIKDLAGAQEHNWEKTTPLSLGAQEPLAQPVKLGFFYYKAFIHLTLLVEFSLLQHHQSRSPCAPDLGSGSWPLRKGV